MTAKEAESLENQGIPGTVVKFKEGSSKFKEGRPSALEWSFELPSGMFAFSGDFNKSTLVHFIEYI